MVISGYTTAMNKVESLVALKNLLYHASQKIQISIDMLTVLETTGEYDCTVIIEGPKGKILIRDLGWCPVHRQDLLECYYWESWAVLQGAYHCCFSIPGKVSLLPE